MFIVPSVKLNSGALVPAIGFGTWAGLTVQGREASIAWILTALKAGYRHIDTAQIYGTEHAVGEAIRQSGIPREQFFVTTKLPWNHPGRVKESLYESLKNAGLDYYDLYLIHWPQVLAYEAPTMTEDGLIDIEPKNEDGSTKLAVNPPSLSETWAEMESVLATGKVKNIGVSNFSIKTLEPVLKTAKVVPAVNQIEVHPYLAQNDLLAYCKDKGIAIAAYSPTGWGPVRNDPTMIAIASKYGVSPARIALAWHLSRGTIAVTASKNIERQKENKDASLFVLPTLAPEDIQAINALDKGQRVCKGPGSESKILGWTLEQLGW